MVTPTRRVLGAPAPVAGAPQAAEAESSFLPPPMPLLPDPLAPMPMGKAPEVDGVLNTLGPAPAPNGGLPAPMTSTIGDPAPQPQPMSQAPPQTAGPFGVPYTLVGPPDPSGFQRVARDPSLPGAEFMSFVPSGADQPGALSQDLQTLFSNMEGTFGPVWQTLLSPGHGPDGQDNRLIIEGTGDASFLQQVMQTHEFPLQLVENGMGTTPGSRRLTFQTMGATGGPGGPGGPGIPGPIPPGPQPPPNPGPNVPPIDPNPDPPPPIDTTGGPGVFPDDNLQQVGQDPMSMLTDSSLAELLRNGMGPRGSDVLGALGAIISDSAGPVGGAGLQQMLNSLLTGQTLTNPAPGPNPPFGQPGVSGTQGALQGGQAPVSGAQGGQVFDQGVPGVLSTFGGASDTPGAGLQSAIQEPAPQAPGGPTGTAGDFAVSPGPFATNPTAVGGQIGQSLVGSLNQLLQGGGPQMGGALGGQLESSLMSLLQNGGQFSPEIGDLQFERATELTNRARSASMNNAQAGLASRGLASVSGVPQGEEGGTLRRIEERIAPEFAAATRDIGIAEQERSSNRFLAGLQQAQGLTGLHEARFQGALGQAGQAADREENRFTEGLHGALDLAGLNESRLANALSNATGLSQVEAQTQLGAINSSTDRQRVLGELALQSLDQNMAWNQFLAEFGLSRDMALEAVRSNRLQDVQGILALFSQFIDSARTGQVE